LRRGQTVRADASGIQEISMESILSNGVENDNDGNSGEIRRLATQFI